MALLNLVYRDALIPPRRLSALLRAAALERLTEREACRLAVTPPGAGP